MALFHLPRITRGFGVSYQSLNNSILSVETALADSVNNIFCDVGSDGSDLVGGIWNMMLLGNITFDGSMGQAQLIDVYSPQELPEQIIAHSELVNGAYQNNKWELTLICDNIALPMRDEILIKHRIIAVANNENQSKVKCYFQTIIRTTI